MNRIIISSFFIIFLLPITIFAQEDIAQATTSSEIFEARVISILEQNERTRENGTIIKQQNLLLKGTEGKWEDEQIFIQGISDIDVISAPLYKEGDRVMVQRTVGPDDQDQFYIIDFVRRGPLYLLVLLFVVTVVLTSGKKGWKALLALVASFVILVQVILPAILAGWNAFFIGLFGAFAILVFIIYLTEGWNRKSHLAIVSVFFSLVVTLSLSLLFTRLTRVTGMANEEIMFLLGVSNQAIHFEGLLLAGILIGAIGVLDDAIVSQIEAVEQIKIANPKLSKKDLFKLSYRVGTSHLGAIINTLFLTYAGASLPLLLLFVVKEEPFVSWSQVINNEMIAIEIVRTLVGSIGIALAVPISTLLAVYWISKNK